MSWLPSAIGSLARLAEQPDLILRGLLSELAVRGIKVSYARLGTCSSMKGVSFEKSLHASELQTWPEAERKEKISRAA